MYDTIEELVNSLSLIHCKHCKNSTHMYLHTDYTTHTYQCTISMCCILYVHNAYQMDKYYIQSMESHDSHVRGPLLKDMLSLQHPSESILVYDYTVCHEMLLMAVNLTSARKPVYNLLTVTVNGGLPTVEFTVSCD